MWTKEEIRTLGAVRCRSSAHLLLPVSVVSDSLPRCPQLRLDMGGHRLILGPLGVGNPVRIRITAWEPLVTRRLKGRDVGVALPLVSITCHCREHSSMVLSKLCSSLAYDRVLVLFSFPHPQQQIHTQVVFTGTCYSLMDGVSGAYDAHCTRMPGQNRLGPTCKASLARCYSMKTNLGVPGNMLDGFVQVGSQVYGLSRSERYSLGPWWVPK